jgi:hypothetical protein
MALMDIQCNFYDKVNVVATGNSDIYDAQAAVNLGENGKLRLMSFLSAKQGTTPTIAYNLVGADDAAFSVNKITIVARATLSDPTVPRYVYDAIPEHTAKRYFRIETTIGGSASPGVTATIGIVLNEQSVGTPGALP